MAVLGKRARVTRRRVSKPAVAAPVLLMVLLLVIDFPAAGQETEVVVNVDDLGPYTADFTVNSSIIIQIKGNVTIETTSASVDVFLGIQIPDGWGATISPDEEKVLFGKTTIEFEGEIIPLSSSEQMAHDIYVWASAETRDYDGIDWGSNPTESHRVSSIINLINNRIQLLFDTTTHQVLPDSTISYPFEVTNVATVEDTFTVTLVDDQALIDQGWLVTTSRDSLTLAPGETGTFYLEQVIPEGAPEGDYEVDVIISSQGHSDSRTTQPVSTKVRVPEISSPFDWMFVFMVGFVITGVGIATFLAATEYGYLAFISLFMPLYVRLKKKDVLSHFTRGQIFGYIQANPGAHYNAIMQDLDLKNGVGAYHLKVLEREGYVKSLKEGIYKRFYPASMRVPEKRLHLSRVQRDILKEVQKRPGVTQKQLSKLLDESKQVVNYHVKILESAGLVRLERSGRETYLFAGKVRYVENGDVYEVVEDAGTVRVSNVW